MNCKGETEKQDASVTTRESVQRTVQYTTWMHYLSLGKIPRHLADPV